MMMDKTKKITVGIDVGAESTKVVLGSSFSCEIVRSPAGLHTTPTAVGFQGNLRQVGETASQKSNNCILHLNRLADLKEDDPFAPFYQFHYDFPTTSTTTTTTVTVEYAGESKQFSSSAILAMLLSSVRERVMSTIQRMQSSSSSSTKKEKETETVPEDDIMYFLSLAPDSSKVTKEQMLDAAYAAGIGDNVQLVDSPVAHACAYQRKFPHVLLEKQGKLVMFVDMGHAQTTVSVVKFGDHRDDNDNDDTTSTSSRPFQVLTSKTHFSLGAASVDVRLWNHFQSTLPKLATVKANSRAGQRLLHGAHELKHLLSQLPEASVTVENVGDNESDVTLFATRTTLAELCQPEAEILASLIQSTLLPLPQQHQDDDATTTTTTTGALVLDALEGVGGACRIPWVQTVLQDITGIPLLSRSLDDTSAALGAALVGETIFRQTMESLPLAVKEDDGFVVGTTTKSDQTRLEHRKKLRQQELAMAAMDCNETCKAEIRNRIETQVLELRSAQSNSKHGSLLPTNGDLDDYLNGLDDWLFSEQADMATLEQMEAKEVEMIEKTKELCGSYFDAVEKDEAAKEKEMEDEAKKAQLEKNNAKDDDDEDHDNRRLPKKRRMEIVMKNKEEANELFKDGNWRFAAARYTKALSHCAKFIDLAPDDIQEVNELKVTLNLNLALAYMKMNNVDQALRVCNEAVALDDKSAKAYFRRASVFYEKKRWDDAKKDITNARNLTENNDKAIEKLGERIDLQLKKEKQKEKKMASKMFG
jgi:molecular chaperone DnaK (HSP70)